MKGSAKEGRAISHLSDFILSLRGKAAYIPQAPRHYTPTGRRALRSLLLRIKEDTSPRSIQRHRQLVELEVRLETSSEAEVRDHYHQGLLIHKVPRHISKDLRADIARVYRDLRSYTSHSTGDRIRVIINIAYQARDYPEQDLRAFLQPYLASI